MFHCMLQRKRKRCRGFAAAGWCAQRVYSPWTFARSKTCGKYFPAFFVQLTLRVSPRSNMLFKICQQRCHIIVFFACRLSAGHEVSGIHMVRINKA